MWTYIYYIRVIRFVFLTLLIQWGAYVFVVKRVVTFDARCLHDAVAGHVVVACTLPAT